MNRPFLTLLFGCGLLVCGFFVGYGFQSRSSKTAIPTASPTPSSSAQAPVVKGLHTSPNGRLLAFTGVWDRSSRAGIWLIDLQTGRSRLVPSPLGWQDFVTQWRTDGRSLLVEREKIPPPVADAKAGIYTMPVSGSNLVTGDLETFDVPLPSSDKIYFADIAPSGEVLIKTRRESKNLWLARQGVVRKVDSASVTYGQNRAVKENGQTVVYVVRDISPQNKNVALFRVVNSRATQISPEWDDLEWSYVSPNGRTLIIARKDENDDGVWTLYSISKIKVNELKTAIVTKDVTSVFWSPDGKWLLGGAGDDHKLWVTDATTLKTTQLGNRNDWHFDNATWIEKQSAVIVASDGKLWRVDVPSGKTTQIWSFPAEYWS